MTPAAAERAFAPRSAEELSEIVRATAAENLALVPVGAGTQLELGNRVERCDATISTRGLARVVEYNAEDQVVSVEAGMTLGELQRILAEHRQRLAIDPPDGFAMTVGGALATNAYGPLALRYGTLKDLIIGIELVRADGAFAHGGGRVVKNVAGFDLPKLVVGSLGTLAIVTKATFRVHPLPEARRTLAFACDADDVFPFVLALREAQLEPASLVAARKPEGTFRIEVAFEGFGPGVDAQIAACSDLVARAAACELDPAPSPGQACGALVVRASFPPPSFARASAEFGGDVSVDPAAGVARMIDPPFEPQSILEKRRIFEGWNGTFVVERMPQEWRGEVETWGAPPPSFPLMQALKARFDPTRRLNPGRFVGGI